MDVPVETTWLLTREAEDAAAEAELLSKAGVKWASVPCIEFVARPWPEWPAREGTPVLFITSRRAATAIPPGDAWRSKDAPGMIAATAPATRAWLEAHGHPVDFWARGGAEELARTLVAAWQAQGRPSWHVRYPTSDAGFSAAEQENAVALLKTVGPVDRAVVYETKSAEGLEDRLEPFLRLPYSLTFSSPSAVKAFLAACPKGSRPADRVVCFGASTVRAWNVGRPEGWPEGEVAESSVVETIVSNKER
ncbi:MAG: uroporphyrinogen-III synthase [Myxococcota bacterium]